MEEQARDVVTGAGGVRRCWWCAGDALYESYHDDEWGRPVADDRRLFEKISLEAFQSGLSWLTILRKRESFRAAFRLFDFEEVAGFGDRDVRRLMGDAGIVRNEAKIQATIRNARRCVELVEERGSLATYVWSFEPAEPRGREPDRTAPTAATASPEAVALSRDLKRRGWSFVGPVTSYSFMQATGLVNDHAGGCSLREPVEAERAAFARPA